MKNRALAALLLATVLVLTLFSVEAHADLLSFPTAGDLSGPVFVQPFAGLAVVSPSGETQPFFSDLPDGSLGPSNFVANILGNFQAFDPLGNPVPFMITSVSVTDASGTFVPDFGEFDFAGNPSLTFSDSFDLDQDTFTAGGFTLAFAFGTDSTLDYSYTLHTDLAVGSLISFTDVETGIPEPSTLILLSGGLVALAIRRRRRGRMGLTDSAGPDWPIKLGGHSMK